MNHIKFSDTRGNIEYEIPDEFAAKFQQTMSRREATRKPAQAPPDRKRIQVGSYLHGMRLGEANARSLSDFIKRDGFWGEHCIPVNANRSRWTKSACKHQLTDIEIRGWKIEAHREHDGQMRMHLFIFRPGTTPGGNAYRTIWEPYRGFYFRSCRAISTGALLN